MTVQVGPETNTIEPHETEVSDQASVKAAGHAEEEQDGQDAPKHDSSAAEEMILSTAAPDDNHDEVRECMWWEKGEDFL